jgi:hypothetical protein
MYKRKKILALVIQSVDCVYKDVGFYSFCPKGYLMGRNENFGFEWRPIIDGNVSKDQLYVRGISFCYGKTCRCQGVRRKKILKKEKGEACTTSDCFYAEFIVTCAQFVVTQNMY